MNGQHDSRDDDLELYEVTADPYTGTGPSPDSRSGGGSGLGGREAVMTLVVILVLAGVAAWLLTPDRETEPAPATPAAVSEPPPTPDTRTTEPTQRPSSSSGSSSGSSASSSSPTTEGVAAVRAARRAVAAYGDSGGKTDEQWRTALLPHLTEAEQSQFRRQPPPREPWTVQAAGLSAVLDHGAMVIVQTSGPRFRVLMLREGADWKADTIAPTSQPVPTRAAG